MTSGDRVHSGRRLVQKHDLRISDQRNRRTQLSLVAAAANRPHTRYNVVPHGRSLKANNNGTN